MRYFPLSVCLCFCSEEDRTVLKLFYSISLSHKETWLEGIPFLCMPSTVISVCYYSCLASFSRCQTDTFVKELFKVQLELVFCQTWERKRDKMVCVRKTSTKYSPFLMYNMSHPQIRNIEKCGCKTILELFQCSERDFKERWGQRRIGGTQIMGKRGKFSFLLRDLNIYSRDLMGQL